MNNLILAILVLGSSAAIWFSQHASLQNRRAANIALDRQLTEARSSLAIATETLRHEKSAFATRHAELRAVQGEFDTATSEAAEPVSPPALDVDKEGAWPVNQPYFYLAKKYLDRIGYTTFSPDQHLTSEAGALFGMTGAEKNSVDDATRSFRDRVHQLQLARREPVQPEPDVNTDNHREISYQIPAMTNEFQALRSQLSSTLQNAIGPDRAALLMFHAQGQLDQAFGQYDDFAYTATYSADRNADGSVRHQIKIQQPDGATYWYGVQFPIEPGTAFWDYRHLFGDQPLIPLPNDLQKDK